MARQLTEKKLHTLCKELSAANLKRVRDVAEALHFTQLTQGKEDKPQGKGGGPSHQ